MIPNRFGMKKRGLSAPPQSSYTANLVIISVNRKFLLLFSCISGLYFAFSAVFSVIDMAVFVCVAAKYYLRAKILKWYAYKKKQFLKYAFPQRKCDFFCLVAVGDNAFQLLCPAGCRCRR